MLEKTDGMFQCFCCLKCPNFGPDDVQVVDESRLRVMYSLKFSAASRAIKYEPLLLKEMETLPQSLKEYVDRLDPQEPGGPLYC